MLDEIVANRTYFVVATVDGESASTRVEPQDVVHQSPHPRVKQSRALAKERRQAAARPLECTAVAGDAE